jgi:hypothetical protein
MMTPILAQTILRNLNDALDYLEHDPQRARNLLIRVIYWMEDEVNGQQEAYNPSAYSD